MKNNLNQTQLKFNRKLGLFLNARKIPLNICIKDIIFLYKDFSTRVKNFELPSEDRVVTAKERFSFQDTFKLSRKYKIISLMQDSLNEVKDLIESVYIQGSFATKDFLENWSDLDVIIVWNANLFKKKENLLRARKVIRKAQLYFYQVDPLAHHSFHMCTVADLDYYPQSIFLPLVVFENSSLLLGKNQLTFKIREDYREQINIISKLVGYFESKLKNPSRNLYDFKLDVAHILLSPSFLLQSKGIYVYKKFSFDIAKREFPQLDFEIVDWASKIRKSWRTPNILKYYPYVLWKFLPVLFNIIFIHLYTRLIRRKKINILTEKEVKEFTNKSYIFLKSILKSVQSD